MPGAGRFGAVDVYYPERGGATAALVVAADPVFGELVEERIATLDQVAEYRPGAFYTRELPAIRTVLDSSALLDLLVVDGYVQLDPDGRPGLGAHVHAALGIPVIGVAKTPFRAATHAVEVVRGEAVRPLLVTAAGLDPQVAAELVRRMAGRYRMPDALRRVDRLSRTRPTAMS